MIWGKGKAADIMAAEAGTSSLDSNYKYSISSTPSGLDDPWPSDLDDDDDECEYDDDTLLLADKERCSLFNNFDWPMTGKLSQAQPVVPYSTEEFPVYTDPGLDLANYGLCSSTDLRILAREGEWDLPPMIHSSDDVWRADKGGRRAWALGKRLSPIYSNSCLVELFKTGMEEVLGKGCLNVQIVRLGWEESIVCLREKKASVVVTVIKGTSEKGAIEMARTCWEGITTLGLGEEIGCAEVMEGEWGMLDVLPLVEQEIERGKKLTVDIEKVMRERGKWFQEKAERYKQWQHLHKGIDELKKKERESGEDE